MISLYVFRKTILLGSLCLVAGCGFGSERPLVAEIEAQPSTTLLIGETASLTIAASGTDLEFEWSAQRGTLSDPRKPSVIYMAPNSPGPDTITVRVTNQGGEVIKSILFEVVERLPTPTPTGTNPPISANTPTPTALPEPIGCNHPVVTAHVFPQLEGVSGQFPMYGPITESGFLCQAVFDNVHAQGKLAIYIKYENVGTNFGWWGVATPNGYDASEYSQVCFWAYAQQPNQAFRLKMKDTTKKERGIVIVTIETPNHWEQICTDISKFSELGIEVDKMENLNLGFEQPTGSTEVWVADFEFR